MSLVIYIHDTQASDNGSQPWDRIEWDEPSLLASAAAKAAIVRAVSESIDDWIRVKRNRKHRAEAQEEITTELSRAKDAQENTDDIPF